MKQKIKRFLGNLFFPERCPFCGEVVGFVHSCKECAPKLAALRRAEARIRQEGHEMGQLSAAFSPYWYEGVVRDGILNMKMNDRPDLFRPFAALQAQTLLDVGVMDQFDWIVPIPSEKTELHSRGYDVPGLLAGELSQKTGKPCVNALMKIRKTKRQMELDGRERRKNLKGAFAVLPDAEIRNKRILLVDDVFTTGSTMNECAGVLRRAGAQSCIGVSIAVTK